MIKKVSIIGAGIMGQGIVQAVACGGLAVAVFDVEKELTKKAVATIGGKLAKSVGKGKMSEEQKEAALSRIRLASSLEDTVPADLVVEAIIEDMQAKKRLFSELDGICEKGCILATNTSALSITEIAESTHRKDKVVGVHFFNPTPVMKLVEIVRGRETSEETLTLTREFVRKIGKTPVDVRESPGFIVNRLLIPMINEAVFACMEGVASREDIDLAMKLGASHPMGPLAVADLIGLDVCLNIMETLHKQFNDDKYRPCPLLKQMVDEGKLGRKSGRGFFEYDEVS